MKYVCGVCGYVYDEDTQGVKWDDLPADWKCPVCGAPKSAFAPQKPLPAKDEDAKQDQPEAAAPATEPASDTTASKIVKDIDDDGELKKISMGQLAAICSNLARGCEKQYMPEEQARFLQMAKYFQSFAPSKPDAHVEDVLALLNTDLKVNYPAFNQACTDERDRGAMRAKVWGEKVTMIQKSLLERYQRDGEKGIDGVNVWICTVCGFIYLGDAAPDICPVCKVPDWKFEKVTA